MALPRIHKRHSRPRSNRSYKGSIVSLCEIQRCLSLPVRNWQRPVGYFWTYRPQLSNAVHDLSRAQYIILPCPLTHRLFSRSGKPDTQLSHWHCKRPIFAVKLCVPPQSARAFPFRGHTRRKIDRSAIQQCDVRPTFLLSDSGHRQKRKSIKFAPVEVALR